METIARVIKAILCGKDIRIGFVGLTPVFSVSQALNLAAGTGSSSSYGRNFVNTILKEKHPDLFNAIIYFKFPQSAHRAPCMMFFDILRTLGLTRSPFTVCLNEMAAGSFLQSEARDACFLRHFISNGASNPRHPEQNIIEKVIEECQLNSCSLFRQISWAHRNSEEASQGIETTGYLNYFHLVFNQEKDDVPVIQKSSLEIFIQSWISAYNPSSHETRVIFSFFKTKNLTEDLIISHFTLLGAGSLRLQLFQDGLEASDAIEHMRLLEQNKVWKFQKYGEYGMFYKLPAMSTKRSQPDDAEFDVVKKQRTIAAASKFTGSDMTEALLGDDLTYFYEFSNATARALSATHDLEAKIITDEAEWMTTDKLCIQGTRVGYTYAAWNPCFGDSGIVKIGATMRDSPYPRLKELSRSTPQDYCLLASIPSAVPFAIEKLCHNHFHASRVWRASTRRRTEFFVVSKDDVEQYFTMINQELAASRDFVCNQ